MASSGNVLSSAGRSSFSQRCNLLSQYLKERGSFGEHLTLGLTAPTTATPILATEERKGTMELLPKIEESNSRTAENGQMIIFYAGQVMVFDEFPAEKAEEIMMLARKSNAAFPPLSPAESATSSPAGLRHSDLASDLPIKRKNSLARFFEKRKDRIAANAPYQVSKPPAKGELAWLGLAPELPFQLPRH